MPERERATCQTLINAVLENEINEEQFNNIYADEITPRISQEEIDLEILECKKNLILALRELLRMGVSEILCEAGFWKQPRNTKLKVKEMLEALIATQEVIQNPAEPLWMTGRPQLHLPDYVKNRITFH